MKKGLVGMLAVLGVSFFGVWDAQAEVREGQWSMTVITKGAGMQEAAAEVQQAMEGMSAEEKAMMQQMTGGMGVSLGATSDGMSTTLTQCLTDQNPVPQMEGQEDCQIQHSVNGNRVQFEVACKDGVSTGDILYEQESMKGTLRTRMSGSGGEDVTMEISGKYLGPCR